MEEDVSAIPVTNEICVKQYSMDATGMLVLQVLVWMWVGSWDEYPHDARDKHWYYRWSGFVTFFPLWFYGFWCFYMILMHGKRRTQEMGEIRVALETGNTVNPPEGVPITAEEHDDEYAKNTSLYGKYLLVWWCLWPVMVKMSYDDSYEYSWSFVLMPLLIYTCYMFFVAIKTNNSFGIDERIIRFRMIQLTRMGARGNSSDNGSYTNVNNQHDQDPFDDLYAYEHVELMSHSNNIDNNQSIIATNENGWRTFPINNNTNNNIIKHSDPQHPPPPPPSPPLLSNIVQFNNFPDNDDDFK